MAIRKRVLLLQVLAGDYDRQVMDGVTRYARHHGHWIVGIVLRKPSDPYLETWRYDGVLVRGSDHLPPKHPLFSLTRPVVEYDLRQHSPRFPCVSADHGAGGRMTAEHFLDLGFRHFAAYTSNGRADQRARFDGFVGRLRAEGLACAGLDMNRPLSSAWSLQRRIEQLARWLRGRPRPLALMLGWDINASRVLEACDRIGLHVPDDVAIIGAGNDVPVCELMWPTLTSVDLNPGQVGFEAARMLDRLMNGEAPAERLTLIPPRGLVARLSTDVVAATDPLVAKALHAMRAHCPEALAVQDLCAQLNVCRRSLEVRFRKAIGRTPAREMKRLRMEHAKHMLRTSHEKITFIAAQCGYSTFADFLRNFRQATGMTPGDYRAALRG